MYDARMGTMGLGDHIWIGKAIMEYGSRLLDCPLATHLPRDDRWNDAVNDYADFSRLTPDEANVLCEWIKNSFIPIRTPNKNHTSYGLKHIFERSKNGFYITNGQFKGAMVECDFHPVDRYKLNWVFRISKRSPALKR